MDAASSSMVIASPALELWHGWQLAERVDTAGPSQPSRKGTLWFGLGLASAERLDTAGPCKPSRKGSLWMGQPVQIGRILLVHLSLAAKQHFAGG
eukprot:scaffold45836_cov92-Phaeocystis_antarctica.AAC.1